MSWHQKHKKATWISAAAVVVVLLGGGTFYFVHAHEEHKAKAEQQSKQKAVPVRVRIIHPKEGGVERLVTRPGSVQSFEYANLYAKVSGYLRDQKVDIGSRVEKDEVLALVYAPEKQKNLEKAKADVHKAEANVRAAKAYLNKAEADQLAAQSRYEQAKTDVQKEQAMLVLRRKQYERYRDLAQKDAVQEELVDEKLEALRAEEQAKIAVQSAVNTALSEVAAAKAAVVKAQADVENAKAAVGVAEAERDHAQVYVEYTRIISPYTGVITQRGFHNGDFIRDASQSGIGGREAFPVLAVARTDKMRIIIYVPDLAVPYLQKDDPVELEIVALPHHHFQGKIARLAYAESFESRTMRAEVDMENPDGLLKAGMYGRIIIKLGREKGLRVPSTCLFGNEKDEVRSVYVVRADRAHEVKVRIGIDDGIEATVREGLDASDQVIAERVPGLSDGSPVEVIGIGPEKAVRRREGRFHDLAN